MRRTPHAEPVTRRRLFAYTGAGAGGLAVGAVALAFGASGGSPARSGSAAGTVPAAAVGNEQLPFYGAHHSGIEAPAQAQGWLIAFDLEPGTAAPAVRALMTQWAEIGAAAASGRPLPSGDDAMAHGRGPGSVGLTVGFGASLLTKLGPGHEIPPELAPLPAFLNDEFDPASSDGDLAVFVAANDGLVAVHALRAGQPDGAVGRDRRPRRIRRRRSAVAGPISRDRARAPVPVRRPSSAAS